MKRRELLQTACFWLLGVLGAKLRPCAAQAVPAPRSNPQRARLGVLWGDRVGKISRHIYGHFAEHLGGCVYDGMWVGPDSKIPHQGGLRKDTIAALKRIQAPMIRWPGGCFADAYHWSDGIGPREKRPARWNLWWGRDESNAFGTDEFLQYSKLSGAEPYICLNVGSGTVQEAFDWMEYCNGTHRTAMTALREANGHPQPYGVRYWAVGNESWGCGGNFDAEDYARHYARFVTYLYRLGQDTPVEFVACGDTRGDWNQKFFETLLRRPYSGGRARGVHHLSLHHYFSGGPGVHFTDDDYYDLLAGVSTLEGHVRKTAGLIDHYAPGGAPIGIAVDEWGVWHHDPGVPPSALFQSNTLRDALLAAVVLNSFNSFGHRISMANIAQTFNVLQCMAFTRGAAFVLTPTYHVYDLYQPHLEAMALKTEVDSPRFTSKLREGEVTCSTLSASASVKESEGKLCLTLVNQHLTDSLEVEVELVGLDGAGVRSASLRQLSSQDVRDENTFEKPNLIPPPVEKQLPLKGNKFVHVIPAHSVQALVVNMG